MTTIHADLMQVLKGLERQGALVRKARSGYRLTLPDGYSMTIAATGDSRTVLKQRHEIIRHGLAWPLDPKPHKPRKVRVAHTASTTEEVPVETENDMATTKATPPAELVEVTPTLAEEWLENNTRNRRLSELTVTKYAQFMKDGMWHYDASPIRFAENGSILDGQHRLWAVIESGTTQTFLVVRGLADHSFATIDTGKTRSFPDILSIEYPGIKSASHVAALSALLYRWHVLGYRNRMLRSSGNGGAKYIAPEVLLKYFGANKDRIVQVARDSHAASQRLRGLSTSVVGLLMWVFEDIDKEDAEFFFARLKDGVGLDAGSPILALRNYLLSFNQSAGDVRSALPTELAAAVVIKAWNAFRRGDEMARLTFRVGGAKPEDFPVPE